MADIYSEGCEYYIKVSPGQAGEYAILPEDPGRCQAITEYLNDAKLVSPNREYIIYTSTLCGEKMSVTSTGIGGPSAAVALEELVHCGTDTFIRVEASGGMQSEVLTGDLVVTTGTVRMDGTGREYTPVEYPAVAHYDVVEVLKHAGEALRRTVHIGVVQCKDSPYGRHESKSMPISRRLEADWKAWKRCGALTSEVRSATPFIVGGVRRVWVSTVLLVIDSQTRREMGPKGIQCHSTTRVIGTATETVKLLITGDRKRNGGKQL